MPQHMPIQALLVLLPLLAAPLVASTRGVRAAQRTAALVAALTLVLAVTMALDFHRSGAEGFVFDPLAPSPSTPLLGRDHLTVVLLPFVSVIALAGVLGGPRSELSPATLGRLLLAEGAYLGLFSALDLRLFAAFWLGTLLPVFIELRSLPDPEARARTSRLFFIYPLTGSLPLLAAIAVMQAGGAHEGLAHPFSLTDLLAHGLPPRSETLAFGLLWISVLVRAGVAPMHGWLPVLFEKGPFWVALMKGAIKPGLFLLLRLSWSMMPHTSERMLWLPLALGLFTALYGSLLGLGQRSLRGLLGALSVSHTGLILAGLSTRSVEGETGGLTQWLAIGTAMSGMALVVWALRRNAGTTAIHRLGGVVQQAPALSYSFLFFGLGALGLPGTLTFIGEDLLLHGLASTSMLGSVVLALSLVINAAAVFRAYTGAFLGRSQTSVAGDLLPRERAAVVGLAALLVLGGLMPGSLVRAGSKAIDSDLLRAAPAAH